MQQKRLLWWLSILCSISSWHAAVSRCIAVGTESSSRWLSFHKHRNVIRIEEVEGNTEPWIHSRVEESWFATCSSLRLRGGGMHHIKHHAPSDRADVHGTPADMSEPFGADQQLHWGGTKADKLRLRARSLHHSHSMMRARALTQGHRVGLRGKYQLWEQISVTRARLLHSADHPEGQAGSAIQLFQLPSHIMEQQQLQLEAKVSELKARFERMSQPTSRASAAEKCTVLLEIGLQYEMSGFLQEASFYYIGAAKIAQDEGGDAAQRNVLAHMDRLYLTAATVTNSTSTALIQIPSNESAHHAQTGYVSQPSKTNALIRAAWRVHDGLSYRRLSQIAAGDSTSKLQRSRSPQRELHTDILERNLSPVDWEGRHKGLVDDIYGIHDGLRSRRASPRSLLKWPVEELLEVQADAGVEIHHGYQMCEHVGVGSFGEVWKAKGSEEDGEGYYILKRIFVEKGEEIRLSGLREEHFGKILYGVPRVCRFIESFLEQNEDNGSDLWLVFRNEGLSLRKYLYETTVEGSMVRFSTSKAWGQLRLSQQGPETLKELLKQLLEGVADCHQRNVTHRDLKPDNLIVHILTPEDMQGRSNRPVLKLADFGSAVDPYTQANLYGENGPSLEEETLDYAPPEVLFGDGLPCSGVRPQSYDIWSVGIIFLELILGTSKVFQLNDRTRAIISNKMRDASEAGKEHAFLLRAMMEYQIYPPQPLPDDGIHESEEKELSESAEEAALQVLIKQRDVLGLGFPNLWALKLIRRLLRWHPNDRLTAERALQHAYFCSHDKGYARNQDSGRLFEFPDSSGAQADSGS